MSHHIDSSSTDGILRITINRPERKNALTRAMYDALADLLAGAQEDDSARVVTLTGQADCFTSGNDMSDFMQMSGAGATLQLADQPVFRFLKVLHGFDKPLVVGVGGAAVGIGTTMLLHCDHIVTTPQAMYSTPFAKLGLCSEAGASLLMPQRMGELLAREMLMAGRVLNGEEALAAGLVNEIAEPEHLLERTEAAAKRLSALPLASLQATKALLKQHWRKAVEDIMLSEGERFSELLRGPAAAEAFMAFMQKRPADFRSM